MPCSTGIHGWQAASLLEFTELRATFCHSNSSGPRFGWYSRDHWWPVAEIRDMLVVSNMPCLVEKSIPKLEGGGMMTYDDWLVLESSCQNETLVAWWFEFQFLVLLIPIFFQESLPKTDNSTKLSDTPRKCPSDHRKASLSGGLEHFFFHIWGMSSSQLTNSNLFQRSGSTTNQ